MQFLDGCKEDSQGYKTQVFPVIHRLSCTDKSLLDSGYQNCKSE